MYGVTLAITPETGEYTVVPAADPTSTDAVSGPGVPSLGATWESSGPVGDSATAPGSSTGRKAIAVTRGRSTGRRSVTPAALAITRSAVGGRSAPAPGETSGGVTEAMSTEPPPPSTPPWRTIASGPPAATTATQARTRRRLRRSVRRAHARRAASCSRVRVGTGDPEYSGLRAG